MFRYSMARVSAALALAIPAVAVGVAAGVPSASAAPARQTYQRVCADPLPGQAACFAEIRTSADPATRASAAAAPFVPTGYSPADLQSAYRLAGASGGNGRTVAIVDAFDDPQAEADLAVVSQPVRAADVLCGQWLLPQAGREWRVQPAGRESELVAGDLA